MSIRWIGSSLSAMAPAARSYSLFPGHTQQAALCCSMLRSGSHEVGTPALELSLQNNSMIGISFDCFGSPRRATTTTYMDGLGRRLTLSLSLQPPAGGSLGAAAWDQHNMHMHMHLRIHLSSFTLTLTFTHCHHAPATFSPPRCHRLTNQPTKETNETNDGHRDGRAGGASVATDASRHTLRPRPRLLRHPHNHPHSISQDHLARQLSACASACVSRPPGHVAHRPHRTPACQGWPVHHTTQPSQFYPPSLSLPPPHHLLTTWVCAAASATCDASACLTACLEPPERGASGGV